MGKINLSRLKNCMVRAEKGEELTIGFFGGSITQGSLATENARRLTIREIDWKTNHRFCMILFVIRNVRILQLRKLYSRKR